MTKYEIVVLTDKDRHNVTVEAGGPMLALVAATSRLHVDSMLAEGETVMAVQVQGEGENHVFREFAA